MLKSIKALKLSNLILYLFGMNGLKHFYFFTNMYHVHIKFLNYNGFQNVSFLFSLIDKKLQSARDIKYFKTMSTL